MHTSRTFLRTKKAISDSLGLVNTGLVPFSGSISMQKKYFYGVVLHILIQLDKINTQVKFSLSASTP